MIAAEPLSTPYWEEPVVAFLGREKWPVDPVGGGWLVHGAVLTAGHVFDALKVLKAQGAKIYIGRCERVVCNINCLYEYEPELIARPKEVDLRRNPVTGDFALVKPPKQVGEFFI